MKQAIVNLVVLAILLLNQTLIIFGWNPLPFSEEQIFEGVSAVATAFVALYTYYKNNNLSKEAQEAQKVLDELKQAKRNENGGVYYE